jgi:hypothetical protein
MPETDCGNMNEVREPLLLKDTDSKPYEIFLYLTSTYSFLVLASKITLGHEKQSEDP